MSKVLKKKRLKFNSGFDDKKLNNNLLTGEMTSEGCGGKENNCAMELKKKKS